MSIFRAFLSTGALQRRAGFAVVSIVVFVLMGVGASSAFALSPWWHLTSGERPAVLQAGAGVDDVQTVTVAGSPGEEFVLIEPMALERGQFKYTRLPVTADAQELQVGLETVYGAGNVAVSGTGPFAVTFKGARAFQWVRPMIAFGPATVAETVHGRPDGEIVLTASNLGDAPLDARNVPVSIADKIPTGLTPVSIEGEAGETSAAPRGLVECELSSLSCKFTGGTLPPYWNIEVVVGVNVTGAPSVANEGSVSGGQGPEASEVPGVAVKREVKTGSRPVSGVEDYELSAEEEGGASDTQAGSHPFQLSTTLTLNQTLADPFAAELKAPFEGTGLLPQPVALAKDLHFKWPAGLIGNPTVFPRCPLSEFLGHEGVCPLQTAVGVANVTLILSTGSHRGLQRDVTPVYNLEPSVGEPARLAFHVGGVSVYIDPSVRSGSDYGVTVSIDNISQEAAFLGSQVTVWGVPGDPRHDISRGFGCLQLAEGSPYYTCPGTEEQHPPPLISMPSSCTGPLRSTVEEDSWLEPANSVSLAADPMPAMAGCNRLPFTPSIEVKPDSSAGSTASGMTVDVDVPQEESLNATGLAEGNPRSITVALPAGVAVNPAGGDGLLGCSTALVGFMGFHEPELQPAGSVATFTESLPEPLQPGVDFCPDASKIGTAEIITPLLPADQHLKGSVYLASQNENPFGSLVAMYIVANDPISGVVVKLAGEVHLSETGQIVTTFENSPQAPFEDAVLHFFGGERAPLATPARCGAYTTNAAFEAWSAEPGEAPRTANSTFNVDSGPNGSACPGASLPFSPALTGGSMNVKAGVLSALTTTIAREDGQQNMQSVQVRTPPGLSGLLTGVKLCGEAQANQGTCGPESLIGETTVSAGVGSDPATVKGGRVYITEKYAGAPFGLSIVNPVKAGPFDLEHDTSNSVQQPACDCIVVRAKIEVDPITAALTVTTDPSGAHAIPHLIDGIPVQIKAVNVLINRPGFIFNPTNCQASALTGAITSDEGASSPVMVPFQVHDCSSLAFQPKLSVSTSSQTSRADGASLKVRVTYPSGSLGTQADIKSVKVQLPKSLPSRLKTLQKACTAKAFDANPASCPPESVIGHAVVHTQVLPVPLEGPAFFVSNGGEAFPNLIIVLQGYGVTVHLVGDTLIKNGITSSTFPSAPDVPFETFELMLPRGEFSALTAIGNLCRQNLTMPTALTAQNGATTNQHTKITVTGCTKHTTHKKKRSRHHSQHARKATKRPSRARTKKR